MLGVKICKTCPFLGQLIEPGRLVDFRTVTAEVAISLVIGKKDQDVRWLQSTLGPAIRLCKQKARVQTDQQSENGRASRK